MTNKLLFFYLNKRIGSNLSGFIRTKSSNEDFPKGEHNISLKESANTDSQISSNDETSLNNNIMPNFYFGSSAGGNNYGR